MIIFLNYNAEPCFSNVIFFTDFEYIFLRVVTWFKSKMLSRKSILNLFEECKIVVECQGKSRCCMCLEGIIELRNSWQRCCRYSMSGGCVSLFVLHLVLIRFYMKVGFAYLSYGGVWVDIVDVRSTVSLVLLIKKTNKKAFYQFAQFWIPMLPFID